MVDYYRYIKSAEWKKKRWELIDQIFPEDDFIRCQECDSILGDEFEVHHLHYDTLGNETESDVLVLCSDCHGDIHDLD